MHEERSNQAVLAKMKHLEEFIAKNKARASTATLAKSKEKQLGRLELTKIESAQPVARIRPPRISPRKGPALRCKNLSIGYPDRTIASDVNIEIDHGMRVAIVGDNGQGKTTFLRTLVDSLKPVTGEVRWGHGCSIGVYAQHVYTSLSEKQTVLEYLYQNAAKGKKDQDILEVAGSFLFRGMHVKKPVSVLSGGERARLCLAGLMLSDLNILILDEPGNHLDVDTVESLADALTNYEGTVIFTSHDRHFTKTVATSIIEVRDSRVTIYSGQYDNYLYKVNKEIEAGERELASQKTKIPQAVAKPVKPEVAVPKNVDRDPAKEIKLVEKNIAQLDAQKRSLNTQLPKVTDIEELDRLEKELISVTERLSAAEDLWSELNDEIQEL
jgi:ATP-binding cassette subfamily F protein 3